MAGIEPTALKCQFELAGNFLQVCALIWMMLCNGRHKIALCSFNFKYWEVANNGQDGLTRLSCNLTRWTDRYSIPRLYRLLPKGYIFIFRIDLSLEKTTRDKVDHQRIIFFYIERTGEEISIKSRMVWETGQKLRGQRGGGIQMSKK